MMLQRQYLPHVTLLVLIEPLGDAGVVEGVSVVGAVQDVLLAAPIHHLARQRQHLTTHWSYRCLSSSQ